MGGLWVRSGKTQNAINCQPKYIRRATGRPVVSWKEQVSHCVADMLTKDRERNTPSIASEALNSAGAKRII